MENKENRERSKLLSSAIEATEVGARAGMIKQQSSKLILREIDIWQDEKVVDAEERENDR